MSGPAPTASAASLPAEAARGAGAGLVATAAMSAVMLAAQRLGVMGRQPPEKITAGALARTAGTHPSGHTLDALALASHVGFGAVAGAVYGCARRAVPDPPAATTGIGFGLLVWGVSYSGVLPAARLMPRPQHDRPGRPTAMALAHVVYGGVLGILVEKGRQRDG